MTHPSVVEQTMLHQHEFWTQIADRALDAFSQELPREHPKRILLIGLGSSYFAAQLVRFSFLRERARGGPEVTACSSVNIGRDVIPMRSDWVLIFTHRGTSSQTQKALEYCYQSGAFTVVICAQDVPALPWAHLMLPTVSLERVEPHTAAVTGALCAATTLLMGSGIAEEWKRLAHEPVPDLEKLRTQVGQGPALLLGEWEGEWLAREGALKLMEMARLPVRVFGSEDFFHGPRFSLRSDDPIWHIMMVDDPRAPEIQAAYRISISNQALRWVPALIELQWLALAVALNRGVDPDSPQ